MRTVIFVKKKKNNKIIALEKWHTRKQKINKTQHPKSPVHPPTKLQFNFFSDYF